MKKGILTLVLGIVFAVIGISFFSFEIGSYAGWGKARTAMSIRDLPKGDYVVRWKMDNVCLLESFGREGLDGNFFVVRESPGDLNFKDVQPLDFVQPFVGKDDPPTLMRMGRFEVNDM